MAAVTATDKRAAEIVRMYEQEGKIVRRVVIEGKRVIEDAKGFSTVTYKLKKAIIRAMGVEIVEV